MTHPAEPERRDPHIGTSNPHQSLWVSDYPYLGPPEEGQPRAGRWHSVEQLTDEDAPVTTAVETTQPHKAT